MKNLKLYSETDLKRKIIIDTALAGGQNINRFEIEMHRRGLLKAEPVMELYGKSYGTAYVGDLTPLIFEVEKHITEEENKQYLVKDLSLLELIEVILIEAIYPEIKIDTLKLEIFLTLCNQERMFRNKEHLMYEFNLSGTIYDTEGFFPVLQSYFYCIGKILVTEYRHDFLINKELYETIVLSPTEGYSEKYQYFSTMD